MTHAQTPGLRAEAASRGAPGRVGTVALVLASALLASTPAPAAPCAVRVHRVAAPGRLLVATPTMRDGSFVDTVVLVLAHDEAGSVGLVLNRTRPERPRGLALRGGGPVGEDKLFVLHDERYRHHGDKELAPGLWLSVETAVVEELAAGRGPPGAVLVVGYAGWEPGQLAGEINAGDWNVIELPAAAVLRTAPAALLAAASCRRPPEPLP